MSFELSSLIYVPIVLGAAHCLRRVVQLATSDSDCATASASEKPEFYRKKVVWITGASSGIQSNTQQNQY